MVYFDRKNGRIELRCINCNNIISISAPVSKIYMRRLECNKCSDIGNWTFVPIRQEVVIK